MKHRCEAIAESLILSTSVTMLFSALSGPIGSDSALNSIVTDVDKIKDSAIASHRCFIVEVMGHDCGYLALMAGLATGAEQVYLPEEGISLAGLQEDLHTLRTRF